MLRRCAVSWIALVLWMTWATSATAQSDELNRLQQDGKTALKAGKLDEAVALFGRGLAKAEDEPTTWKMLLGLALAHELKEDWVLAAMHYQAFLSRSAGHPEARAGRWATRRKSATEDVAKIEPEVLATHALLSVTTEQSGVSVSAPGTPEGLKTLTPIALYLLPGQHQIELEKDGFASMILVVSVDKGQRVNIQRSLVELDAAPPPPEPVAPAPEPPAPSVPAPQPAKEAPEPPPPSPVLEVLGWTLTGLGVVGLGFGVGFTVAAKGTADDLDALQSAPLDETALQSDAALRDQLRDQQAGAAAFYAAGGALALSGALLLLLRPQGPLDVVALIGPSSAGIRMRL